MIRRRLLSRPYLGGMYVISVKCDCGKVYRVADDMAGAEVECKACGRIGVVPSEDGGSHAGSGDAQGGDRGTSPWAITGGVIILGIVLALSAYLVGEVRKAYQTAGLAAQKHDGATSSHVPPVAPQSAPTKVPTGKPVGAKTEATATVAPGKPAEQKRLTAEEVFALASPAVVRVEVRDQRYALIGQGSGFFISGDGLIATCFHVIERAHFAVVKLANGSQYFVEGVAAVDRDADLAILRVMGKELPHLDRFAATAPRVGARVFAIGNPQGLTNTLSDGLVSGIREEDEGARFIQTTAAVSPGSSGGPLVSESGSVLGIVRHQYKDGQNLNFAVPAERLVTLVACRGPLKTLASAGGGAIRAADAAKLDAVWAAYDAADYAKALDLLSGLQGSMESSAYWFVLGAVHMGLGNLTLSIQAHLRLLELLDPGEHALRGLVLFQTAVAYDSLKQAAKARRAWLAAVEDLEQAVALNTGDALNYTMLGSAYRDLGRPREAIAALRTAVMIDPKQVHAWTAMGWAYSELGQHKEAIAAFKAALAVDGKADVWSFLAAAYQAIGQVDEAIAAYKRELVVEPDNPFTHFFLNRLYRRKGWVDLAIYHARRAAQLDPDGKVGKSATEDLQGMMPK